jgi:hypothetical protein
MIDSGATPRTTVGSGPSEPTLSLSKGPRNLQNLSGFSPWRDQSTYFGGGTYSLGKFEPSPKKNCSNCFTITS